MGRCVHSRRCSPSLIRGDAGPEPAETWHAQWVLTSLPYVFAARPRVVATDPHPDGINCRSLLQGYLETARGVFLPRAGVEQPGLWERTGRFLPLTLEDGNDAPGLPHECVLLAERIRDRDGARVDRSRAAFADEAEYRMRLHTAVLLRTPPACVTGLPVRGADADGPLVLHATSIDGSACLWSWRLFLHHYRLVAAKDVL